ncbi:MAG: molybdopterin-dependent oxidoreductase [Promethearchaeota archaeon]
MKETRSLKKIRFGTCSKDCYGSCVFTGTWDDNMPEKKFLKADPMKAHPFTNGFFCPKLTRRQDLIYHKDRVKNPLIRTGPKPENNFKSIPLEHVLNIIAEKIIDLNKKNQLDLIIGAFYSGNSGLISKYAPLRFFNKLEATITGGGICNEGGCAGLTQLFGTYSTTNPFQINNPSTKLIVIWGSNLSETNNHAYYLVKKAIKMGVKLVVVDSRHTVIAKKADCFLHIMPGTENLFVAVTIKELIQHNAYDEKFLSDQVNNYSLIFSEIRSIDKRKVLEQIGIDVQTFKNFVDLLIKFKHYTLFSIGYGIQKDIYGGRIVKSIALIQIILGNLGKPGSGLIYSQSGFLKPILQPLIEYIAYFNEKPKIKEIPIVKLGSILSSVNYQILFIYNFNPASSLPNQNILRNALLKENLFTVVIDMFLNETTKFADVVIPAKFDLETYDLISPYYIPGLSINIGGPCSYEDCLSNNEFFQKLAWKLGFEKNLAFQESENTILNNCLKKLPLKIQDCLQNNGFYLLFDNDDVPFVNLDFPTSNNQIQITGPLFKFGDYDLKRKFNLKVNEFMLLSPSHSHFLHSQLEQLNSKYSDDFNKIYLLSEDIESLNLEIGHEVIVSNEYGTETYKVAESTQLKHKTALIYHGLSSSLRGTPNVNCFIPDKPEELGHSGSFNSAIIEIRKK